MRPSGRNPCASRRRRRRSWRSTMPGRTSSRRITPSIPGQGSAASPCRRPAGRARPASPLDGQVQPVAPIGPAAVVDGDVVVADERQDERELRRRRSPIRRSRRAASRGRRRPSGPARAARRRRGIAASPGRCMPATGTLIAPGMCPRRRALPWRPRNSAGARASRIWTSGAPRRPAHVSCRQADPQLAARRERARGGRRGRARELALLGGPGVDAAVEDPRRLEAVDAQAPPRPRREESQRVVVEHHAVAVADARPGQRAGDLVGRREQEERALVLLGDELGRPVEVCRARNVAGSPRLRGRSRRAASGRR